METSSVVSNQQNEELAIFLRIEEATGVNSADSILLQASLSNNCLCAEPVKTGYTTLFTCNLVWETDRKAIRRMKMENLPVKIDCFALRNSKSDKAAKEHVGYILFQVKNIPIVSLSKALQMKPKWMKLIGLSKDWRQHKPEFLMSLLITSRDFLTLDRNEILETQGLESGDSIYFEENPIPCMLTSQRGLFIRLLKKEGLLQVGNIDTNCDIFTVQITVKNVRYLENIKPGEMGNLREVFMNYVLLGIPHTRSLDRKFNRSYQIQEKVSINFRSSLVDLQEYLEKIFFIPIEFVSADKTLGTAEIKANELIRTTNLQEFIEKNSGVLEIDGICNLTITNELQNVNRPIIEYKLSIQYIATKKLHQTECLENYKRSQEIDTQAGGDFAREPSESKPSKSRTLSIIPEVRSESDQMKSVEASQPLEPIPHEKKPSVSLPGKVDINAIIKSVPSGNSSELPRLFSCNLRMRTLKFNRTPEKGIWQFSFFHSGSVTPRTFINKELNLGNSQLDMSDQELKLYFTAPESQIIKLVTSPDVCSLCIKGPRETHAKAQLDCQSLLIGSKQNVPSHVLLQDKSGQIIAVANVSISLEDLGLSSNVPAVSQVVQDTFEFAEPKPTLNDDQKMAVLDDSFTHQIVAELDEWKKSQELAFLNELKKKEEMLIDRLKCGWTDKQAVYEQDLVVRVDKLSHLAASLQAAQKSLKEKEQEYLREEKATSRMKQELEKSYNNQLMAIRERARRMEDDLLHEMKLKEIRSVDVERCNQHLKAENCELHQRINSLMSETKELKANLVPKCEVEKILQELRLLKEKLEATQQSKLYYKEKWAKSCRENHKIRRENIISAKGELFTAQCDRLNSVLEDQNYQLNMDQEEVAQIKHFLNLSDGEL